MNRQDLGDFIHAVMNIKALTPGMGGASAGVLGTSAFGDQVVFDVKGKVFAFAELYQDKDADLTQLQADAQAIAGMFQALLTISVITEQECDRLSNLLQDLLSSRT